MTSKKNVGKGTAFAYDCKFTQYGPNTQVRKNKNGTIALVSPKKKSKK